MSIKISRSASGAGLDLVNPVEWEESGPENWSLLLHCPNCDTYRAGIFGQRTVDAFDEALDRGADALASEYERLVRANMAEEIERFVVHWTRTPSSRRTSRDVKPAPRRPATPPSEEIVLIGAPIALRDGSRVRIRRLRDSDRELLLRGFRRLSPESRYRRFLAPTPRLSEGTVGDPGRDRPP